MQDVAGLLEAVSAFQTVGPTTSPLPSTTPSTTTSTTTTTTTLAAHLVAGADIIMTEPLWVQENTTWRSADGVRALAKKVEILPGVTLTIEGSQILPAVLSFVHGDASIALHPQARLVVRNAAFYTPFRGWRNVPYSDRPPSIYGIRFVSGGGTVVIDNLICEGLSRCVFNVHSDSHVTIKNSLFVDNERAIDAMTYSWRGSLEIKRSIFFHNERGLICYRCSVEDSLFLQNNIATSGRYIAVGHTSFAQNGQAVTGSSDMTLNDALFYGNDIAVFRSYGSLQNITFLENHVDLKIHSKVAVLENINFLGGDFQDYHLHYTGTELYDLDVSRTFWNTTSLEQMENHIYDALDGSGAGVVQILNTASMPPEPFQHPMYLEGPCAGQCEQQWFNSSWSSLISAGAGTFGFFDPDRTLNSGQVLREALLNGYQTVSGMSLSTYMQDVAGLLEAVSAFQTVGPTTSPLPSTTPSTTTSTTTTTTTLAAQLVAGADIIMTEPLWVQDNTTWRSADGIRALAKKVEILPGVTLTIEGSQILPAVLSFVHGDASIALHPQARLVVRNAAFYTPFRGWRNVPYSDRPPSIYGIRFVSGGGTVVIDNLICEGLSRCVFNVHSDSHVTIKNSLFVDNERAIDAMTYSWRGSLEIKRSIFFHNERGLICYRCSVEDSLFLQNNIATSGRYIAVGHTSFAQNGQAVTGSSDMTLNDALFYGNDIAVFRSYGSLQNITFLENHVDLKIHSKVAVLENINFLGGDFQDYHLHYTGTELYDLDVSRTFWNTTSLEQMENHIYDALDGSGAGVVQILNTASMPPEPFQHPMYLEGPCAGQCEQQWFNSSWSSLISAGAGTFGFFDPDRTLNSGQVLREALLNGYQTVSGMSLSAYMQDVAGLLEAISAFQTVGVSTTMVSATLSATTTRSTSSSKIAERQMLGSVF
eukprot:Skav207487  [mRNA]  locus=scaffold334:265:6498:+ [translate_table: standard]